MEPITIRGLTHSYKGGQTALQDIDLDIGIGMFGLLGPNGAGKTTLIRILATLLEPTSGKIEVDGLDLRTRRKDIRRATGYLPQEFADFPALSAWEFLDYAARLRGIRPGRRRRDLIDQTLEDVGLYEARDRKAGRLSGGMKRRLGIAQTLIGDPRIIIIDEPTTGLDPEERVRFRNLLSDLARRDKIIILSTHIVGDISSTCSRIVLLERGRVVFDGAPAELESGVRGKVWMLSIPAAELDELKKHHPVISAVPSETGYRVRLIADDRPGGAAEPAEPTLEDAYVFIMDGILGRRGAADDSAPDGSRRGR